MSKSKCINPSGWQRAQAIGFLLTAFLAGGCGSNSKVATATPTFSPAPTTAPFTSSQTVTISDTTPGAVLYCTIDGSTPTTASAQCSEPTTVSKSETLKAIAVPPNGVPSAVASADYVISPPSVAAPVITPAAGTYNTAQTVTITDATSGASLYYTLDGTDPASSASRKAFSAPFSVTSTTNVIAVATVNGGNSVETSDLITITGPATVPTPTPTPTITAVSGTNAVEPNTLSFTLSDSDKNAALYYTTDGTTPTQASQVYSGAVTVSSTQTINAIAFDASGSPATSMSATATFTIADPAPTFTPASGQVQSGASVTLADADSKASIYYTTDGSIPTAKSTVYTAPFTVTAAETVNAAAANTAAGYALSAVGSATYTLPSAGSVTITGTVVSGNTPVQGATVELFAAGTTGYGAVFGPVTPLMTSTPLAGANTFSLSFNCPDSPGDQLYLVSTGGTVGTNKNNTNIVLMAALGTCKSIGSSATVVLNEVTTVASAYALAEFSSPVSSGGIVVGAPTSDPTNCVLNNVIAVGAGTCNYTGLVNAFKTVSNLVDLTTGTSLTITEFYSGKDPNNLNGYSYQPAGAAAPISTNNPVPAKALNTSTVPNLRINTLANILSTCVQSASACTALYSAATPSGGKAPIDTLQAVLDIAQHPGANAAKIFALQGTKTTYTPNLTAAPTDLILALTFTGGGLGIDSKVDFADVISATGLAIDAQGNIWVTAGPNSNGSGVLHASGGMIAGFDTLGRQLTPATTLVKNTSGQMVIAKDASTGYNSSGGFGPNIFRSGAKTGAFQSPNLPVIDQGVLAHLWLTDTQGSDEVALSPLAVTLSGEVVSTPSSIQAIDASGNLWGGNYSQLSGAVEIPESSSAGALRYTYQFQGPTLSPANFAFDTNNGLWAPFLNQAPNQTIDVYQLSLSTAINASTGESTATASDTYHIGDKVYRGMSTLVPGASGNMVLCASGTQTVSGQHVPFGRYLVFNPTTSKTTFANAYNSINNTCGSNSYVTVDGAGNIWSVAPGFLDEVSSAGKELAPPSGFTGTSSAEFATLQGVKGIGIDGSGNLWIVNTQASSTANALVEFIGVAAPTINPLSVAVQNGAQGTLP